MSDNNENTPICAIISGGTFSPLEKIEEAEMIIACDKGWDYAQQCGIVPDLVLGDFDSARELPCTKDVNVLRLPTEKDDTDTVAAIRIALEKGYRRLHIYCALGGRLDHLLGNLQAALMAARQGALVRIFDTDNEMTVWGGGTQEFIYKEGFSLSVLSLTDRCRGVSIEHAQYTLTDAVLTNAFPVGISNEWKKCHQPVRITVEDGILLAICSRIV